MDEDELILPSRRCVGSPFLFLGLCAVALWPRTATPLPGREIRSTLALFIPFASALPSSELSMRGPAQLGGVHRATDPLGLGRVAGSRASAPLGPAGWRRLWRWPCSKDRCCTAAPGSICRAAENPLERARGSRNLAVAVQRAQERTGAQFVITNRYMTSALLSFYLPGQPATYLLPTSDKLNQMLILAGLSGEPSEGGCFVGEWTRNPAPAVLHPGFARIDLLASHDAVQDGRLSNASLPRALPSALATLALALTVVGLWPPVARRGGRGLGSHLYPHELCRDGKRPFGGVRSASMFP